MIFLLREREGEGERVCVPGKEEGLIQTVKHVDDEVVIGNGVNIRARELAIDENSLQRIRVILIRLDPTNRIIQAN